MWATSKARPDLLDQRGHPAPVVARVLKDLLAKQVPLERKDQQAKRVQPAQMEQRVPKGFPGKQVALVRKVLLAWQVQREHKAPLARPVQRVRWEQLGRRVRSEQRGLLVL